MPALHFGAKMVDLVHDELLLHADEQQREPRGNENANHEEGQNKPRLRDAQTGAFASRQLLQFVRRLRQTVGQQRRQLERFILVDLVLDDECREEAAIHTPRVIPSKSDPDPL